jgi:hypothetical protein
MRFVTITTKYPGTCQRCGGAVPVGTRVRFGAGRIWELAARCANGAQIESGGAEDFRRQQAAERRAEQAAEANLTSFEAEYEFR